MRLDSSEAERPDDTLGLLFWVYLGGISASLTLLVRGSAPTYRRSDVRLLRPHL